jgi:hypothetical protein
MSAGGKHYRRQLLVGAAALVALAGMGSTSVVVSAAPTAGVASAAQVQVEAPDFGPNVTIFDPSMPTAEIQEKFDEIWGLQRWNEMGSERYSFYFMPGEYGSAQEPLLAKVGYYTEVAGLGASPGDVQINGKVEVFNRCYDEDGVPAEKGNCFALNNFWRSMSNLTINVTPGAGSCQAGVPFNTWAVSQAVSMRRVDINGFGDELELFLRDVCNGPGYASGGYIADSRFGLAINDTQQQWYARNSEVGEWSNAVWNQVFSGMDFTNPSKAPVDSAYPKPPYTVLDRTPVSREKPYLFVDDKGAYMVRVPAARKNTRGISWADGITPGRSIPVSDFFVADPSDSVQAINNALARGKNLILTPGVYDIARSIEVNRPNAVVLGLGQATLTAVDGATPLRIGDRPGIIVAGVTVDAGEVESPVLLQVGSPRGSNGSVGNPTTLSDVYFRVGGPHVGKADVALQVNSDNVLIDHTWVWRADHGVEGFDEECAEPASECLNGFLGDNQRWATNIGRNGVVVNGDNVTATGFFVEHFQEYNTIWNGERGRVLLYQNELPYDPPTQDAWTADDGTLGWAAYKVADNVKQHELWGGGVYVFNRNNPSIVTENGYEVPDTPGVTLTHVMTKNLSGPGTINYVVNGFGETVNGIAADGIPEPSVCDAACYEAPSYVISYSNGAPVLPVFP